VKYCSYKKKGYCGPFVSKPSPNPKIYLTTMYITSPWRNVTSIIISAFSPRESCFVSSCSSRRYRNSMARAAIAAVTKAFKMKARIMVVPRRSMRGLKFIVYFIVVKKVYTHLKRRLLRLQL